MYYNFNRYSISASLEWKEKLQSDSLLSRSWSSRSLGKEVMVSWKFDDTFEWLSTNGEGWYTMLSGFKLIMWSPYKVVSVHFHKRKSCTAINFTNNLKTRSTWMNKLSVWQQMMKSKTNTKDSRAEHKGQLYFDISLTLSEHMYLCMHAHVIVLQDVWSFK